MSLAFSEKDLGVMGKTGPYPDHKQMLLNVILEYKSNYLLHRNRCLRFCPSSMWSEVVIEHIERGRLRDGVVGGAPVCGYREASIHAATRPAGGAAALRSLMLC